MSRHILAAIAAVACLGCSRGAGSGPTEIVYWTGWSGHELDAQQKLIDEFNRTHPNIHVRMVTQFGNSGYQKVRIAFAGNATPDVMSTVWAEELGSYSKRGVLEPLDSYMRASGRDLDKEFVPGIANAARIDGKVYGLAVTTNTLFIVYNKKIFRAAGLDPDKPPRTTAELDRYSKLCTERKDDGSYIRYGFRPTALQTWAYVFGGKWFDKATGKVTANDPHNVAALRWMASYNKQYDLKRIQSFQSTFGSDSTASGPFFVGNVAMWATGEWAAEFIRRYGDKIEYGWCPLPVPPGGLPNTTSPNGSAFVIPAACKHKKEAWEFLNWITSPHAVGTFCKEIANVPPLKVVGDDPYFQKKPLLKFAVWLSRQKNAFGPPGIVIWPTYVREIQRAEDAAMLGNKDPKELLDDLQRRMSIEHERSLEELAK